MKMFTRFVALCATFFTVSLVAQPTTSAPTPTKAAADVVSIFSGAYTDLTGTNFFPDWGQGTVVSDYTVAGTSDITKKYALLDYQGTQFATAINASAMSALHLDVWTDVVTTFQLFPINPGSAETAVEKTTTVGWNSFEILLSEFTAIGLPMTGVTQFKIQEKNFAYRAGTKNLYFDNIYFWKPANVPTLTGFAVAPKFFGDAAFALTAPSSPSSGAFTYTSGNMSVATISGNMVTITGVGTTTITANQAAAGAYAAGTTSTSFVVSSSGPASAAPAPTKLAANVISLFSNTYTDVPVERWSTSWGVGALEDVMISGNATKKYTGLTYTGIDFSAPVINGTTMTSFHMDVWTPDAAEFKVKIRDFGANGTYDGGDDSESAEISITPTANTWVSFDLPLTSFTGLNTKAHLGQMVIVTPGGGKTAYVDNVYFYKDPSVVVVPTTPTAAAPTPALMPANVHSLFSGGAYTDLVGTSWNRYFDAVNPAVYTEMMVAGNLTQKYTNMGYSVTEPAAPINGTRLTNMHMDVWSPVAAVAGAFKMKLVDFGSNGTYGFGSLPGDDTEGEVNLPALAAATWTSIDIPLSDFALAGMTTKASIAQIIPSGPGGATLFMDNVYFSAATPLAVEMTTFNAKTVNQTTVLNWETASEKDNAGFTIERSTNATNFTTIGTVKGNGTTNNVSNYTFTDNAPLTGLNYYRLRQSDVNGKESISKVVSVLFGKATGLYIKNTLVHDVMDITVGDAEKGPLSIFNVAGQLVYSIKIQGNQQINLSNLTAGMYIARTATGEARRFVKD